VSGLFIQLDRGVATACRWIVIGCFAGLFLLLALGIAQRLLPIIRLSGYDELIELLFVWMIFVGALALWREGSLYRVNAIDGLLSRRVRQAQAVLIQLGLLSIAVLLAVKGADFARQSGETTPFLQANKIYWYAAIPICGTLMSMYSAAALWRALRGDASTDRDGATLG
jgi:TRAP-type C4-dicarboxylate transport system permease small subunit